MVTWADRNGSTSICSKPQFSPIHYHWYRTATSVGVVATVRELATEAGLSEFESDGVVGEFTALMRSLIRGHLRPIEHVKGPMGHVRDISVFEVRTSTAIAGEVTFAVRAYHVEPKEFKRPGGSTIVGLHVHRKDLSDPAKVNDLQDVELDAAREKYYEGLATKWGGAQLLPAPSD